MKLVYHNHTDFTFNDTKIDSNLISEYQRSSEQSAYLLVYFEPINKPPRLVANYNGYGYNSNV